MPASASELYGLRGVRVLLVEDDPDLRESLADSLEIEGAEVATAPTGNSGFERFLQVRPQVILSDLWMPDGTGYDLISRVRTMPPEAGGLTPAIALSGGDNAGAALVAGFQVFLAKPFSLLHLVSVIAELAG